MHFLNTLILFGLTASTVLADSQVNFYSDSSCNSYVGTSFIPSSGGDVVGPSNAHSGMFITLDLVSFPPASHQFPTWGFTDAQGHNEVDNPRVWTPELPGQCVSVANAPINAFGVLNDPEL